MVLQNAEIDISVFRNKSLKWMSTKPRVVKIQNQINLKIYQKWNIKNQANSDINKGKLKCYRYGYF